MFQLLIEDIVSRGCMSLATCVFVVCSYSLHTIVVCGIQTRRRRTGILLDRVQAPKNTNTSTAKNSNTLTAEKSVGLEEQQYAYGSQLVCYRTLCYSIPFTAYQQSLKLFQLTEIWSATRHMVRFCSLYSCQLETCFTISKSSSEGATNSAFQ